MRRPRLTARLARDFDVAASLLNATAEVMDDRPGEQQSVIRVADYLDALARWKLAQSAPTPTSDGESK